MRPSRTVAWFAWLAAALASATHACPPVSMLSEALAGTENKSWKASLPVARPGFATWLAKFGVGPQAGSYSRCIHRQLDVRSTFELDCLDHALKPVPMLARMAGLDPATRAVRIPKELAARLHQTGGLWFGKDDPGMGSGSTENYVLIKETWKDGGGEYASPFCLVHGSKPNMSGRAESARAQLREAGITDPALLALAWDVPPPGQPIPFIRNFPALLIPYAFLFAFLLASRFSSDHELHLHRSALKLARGIGWIVGGVLAADVAGLGDWLMVAPLWGAVCLIDAVTSVIGATLSMLMDGLAAWISGHGPAKGSRKQPARSLERVTASAPRAASAPESGHCPVCSGREAVGGWVACPTCNTAHHEQCWTYNGGCSIFGCRHSHDVHPDGSPSLTSVVTPACNRG